MQTLLADAYDYNGNTLTKVVGSNTTSYAWDFENRMSSVTLPGSGGTVTFKYDPFGRRIYKSSSTATSVYAYDGDNLVEEANASGAVVARYEDTQNIDEPLAMLRSSATSYFHADGLGSITSLSSAAGSIANTYTYDSFGKLTASTGSLVNPFQYTARESDSETGLYYYRARYYDPNAGRFLSEDRIGFKGGIDFYRYVRNSPSNLRDPSGLYTLKNFTPVAAAQMTIAIGKLVAKLNSSCCIDPDVRRRILNHLQPFSYGSGATFTFYPTIINNGESVDGQASPFFDDIDISEGALDGSSQCPLEGILLHELVHLTWHNAWLGFRDPKLAEADAYAKSIACYGTGCQERRKP